MEETMAPEAEVEIEVKPKSTEDRLAAIEDKLDVLMASIKPEPEDINDLPSPAKEEAPKPDLAAKYSKMLAKA